MKTFKLILLFSLFSLQLFAQESSLKGVISGSGIIAGRGMVQLTITSDGTTLTDSCLLGLDSSYTFKVKLNGFSLVQVSYMYGTFYSDSYLLLPGESINTKESATEEEVDFAAKVMARSNNLNGALEAFQEFDFNFNYGLLDSVSFNALLLTAKQNAIEILNNGQDTLPPALHQLALNTIELKASEIYLNYAFLGRFQQKNKTINLVSPLFIEPIKNIAKLKVFPNTEYQDSKQKVDSLISKLIKVNFDIEKLSPAYQILNNEYGLETGLFMYQVFPKSDGPNCNYGYTAAPQSVFLSNEFYEEGNAGPEGWLISPQYERAYEFKDDGYAIVLDGMHYKLINLLGQTVLQGGFEDLAYYDSGIYLARKYNKYGLIYANGQAILDYQYEALNPLGNDLFAFRFPGSPFMGMMDKKGNEIVKPRYSNIKPFEGKEYAITVLFEMKKWTPQRINGNRLKMPGQKMGVIDLNGKELLAPGWYSIVSQSHNLIQSFPLVVYKRNYSSVFRRFKIKDNFKLLDQTGKLFASNKRYPKLNEPGKHYYFSSNLQASVLRNTEGTYESKPFRFSFNGISSIGDDYFIIRTLNQKSDDQNTYLLKDAKGPLQIDTFDLIQKYDIANDYDDYNNSQSSIYRMVKQNCHGVMNASGKMVLAPIYDEIEGVDSLLFVNYKGLYAVFDTSGKQLTPFKYKNISSYSYVHGGLLEFETETGTQISDRNLKVLFEAPSKDIWFDGSSDLRVCNWSYLKDDLLWQFNGTKHLLPYKDTLHYRYLTKGSTLDYHIVNKNGKWLGSVESEETLDESKPLVLARFGEQIVVDLKTNKELKGNFSNITPLYLDKNDLVYTSRTYSSNDTLAKFYIFATSNQYKGLSNADFQWVLDTTYKNIVVSASFILAKKEKQVQMFDLQGKRYFDEKFRGARSLLVDADKYVRLNKLFGGYYVYHKSGERLIKAKKGSFNITPKGNLLLVFKKGKQISIYDSLGHKLLKQTVKSPSNVRLGLMRVKKGKKGYFMTIDGQLKSNWPLNSLGWPIIPEFASWLDTSNAELLFEVDSSRTEWGMGFEPYLINNIANFKINNSYEGMDNQSNNNFWLPNNANLRVEPKLAAAAVMAQWISPENGQLPQVLDLKPGYINLEISSYNDGDLKPRVRSFYLQNDSIFMVNPFGYFDKDNRIRFARLLTDKMGTDESINWNVCVKQEELFNFLSPEFKLTDTGVEVIIRSLKVQNAKTNEIKIALSKEEVLPYLVPSTHFYQWFKKR